MPECASMTFWCFYGENGVPKLECEYYLFLFHKPPLLSRNTNQIIVQLAHTKGQFN